MRTHIGERPRKEGGGRRVIHVHSFAAPKRGQEVGQIRTAAIRRSPLQSEQPRYTDIGRERPVLAKLKRRSAGSLSSHSMTVPRAGAELQPHVIVSLVQREGLQVFTPSPLAIPCGSSSFRVRPGRPRCAPSVLGLRPHPPQAADGPRRAFRPQHKTAMSTSAYLPFFARFDGAGLHWPHERKTR